MGRRGRRWLRPDPNAEWRRPDAPSDGDPSGAAESARAPVGTARGRPDGTDDDAPWRPGGEDEPFVPAPIAAEPAPEPTVDATPVLTAERLVRTYPGGTGVLALRGVSLAVAPGDFLALMGPSGSGKTTLLGLLSGLDAPDEGRVLWRGRPMTELSSDESKTLRRKEIGVVFQSFGLLPTLSAVENVELPLRVNGSDPDEATDRAAALLSRLALSDRLHNRTFELSAGQQQRVAVARALVAGPDVVLADEPIAEVDSENADLILDALADVARRGGAVVVATHNPAALSYAASVMLLRDGKIEASGSPDEMSHRLSTD